MRAIAPPLVFVVNLAPGYNKPKMRVARARLLLEGDQSDLRQLLRALSYVDARENDAAERLHHAHPRLAFLNHVAEPKAHDTFLSDRHSQPHRRDIQEV